MRIALAWIVEAPLTSITVRYERYVRGFQSLGHDVVTVCHKAAAVGYEFPTLTTDDLSSFCDPMYWKSIGADLVLVVSWLSFPNVIAAIHESGSRVVAVSDSDGVFGVRVHPAELLRRMILQHTRLRDKLGSFKYWIELYSRTSAAADQSVLRSAAASDSVAVTSEGARSNLKKFFEYYARTDLSERITVVPYPIDDNFLSDCDHSHLKNNQLLAIGRWDDPQKDAKLLAESLRAIAPKTPNSQFLIVGRNGGGWFDSICATNPNVRYFDVLRPYEVAELMKNCRCLLTTSRWESGPIVLNEALASGCTIIGPNSIPTVADACQNSRFGTQFGRRTAQAVATAIQAELRHWDEGRRDAQVISEHWMPRFSPQNVCRRFIASLGKDMDSLQSQVQEVGGNIEPTSSPTGLPNR